MTTILFIILYVFTSIGLEAIYRRGIGWDNLPDHINTPKEWDGKDDDKQWYTRWMKQVKGIFAYSWSKKHWFGKLRKNPITILAVFGPGDSRWENDILAIRSINTPVFFYNPGKKGFYLSRVQYYTDWHFMIQWPLFIGFHIKFGKTGLVNFYAGFKRDTDVYWWPSLTLGGTYK